MGASGNALGDGEAMTTVERVGEGLARQLNRRQTLKRAAVAVFGAVAAWTVEGFRGNSALAQECSFVSDNCGCTPPEGVYCSGLDPSFCAGSACSGACYWDETYRYAGACWCSATCSYDGGESGYYHCCDCNCHGQLCACREFISTGYTEEPVPEEPSGDEPREPRDDGRLPPPPGAPPLPPPGYDGPPLPPPCFPFCD
jgi:hypothetical protein